MHDDASEFATIERISVALGGRPPAGDLWIGDDAAVVSVSGRQVALAADALVEGVHFDLSLTTIEDAGWKAIAVNVSDLAAMGLAPLCALVTVVAPVGTSIDGLYAGIAAAASEFGCPVVGGDLSAGPVVVVSASVVGNVAPSPPPVHRAGAREGDVVWVSGPLGGASAALRELRGGGSAGVHARPVPRVAEGIAARELGATSMIDVSDGFAADLGHVLDASAVGAVLDAVPVAAGASLEDALHGGDDYELIWTAPAAAGIAAGFAARGLPVPVPVGLIVGDPGRRELDGRPLLAGGWEHRF